MEIDSEYEGVLERRDRRRKGWTAEEEAALRAGVAKHGVGNWAKILEDPEFSTRLVDRTNVDLKDKWRNLEKKSTITKKSKTSPASTLPTEIPGNPNLADSSLVRNESTSAAFINECRFNAMAFEGISKISGSESSDNHQIRSCIEMQVGNSYKISTTEATKQTQTLNREEASEVVAEKVAESENRSFIATKAIQKAEEMENLADENNTFHQLCLEIHRQCTLGREDLQ